MISEAAAAHSDRTEFHALVRHLAHELRQPLSGMESIAYYLDMVLPAEDENLRSQVDNLRQMVQQASWILDDAVHSVRVAPATPEILRLDHFVARLTADVQLREEHHLHVHLMAPRVDVTCDVSQAEYLIGTLLDFFRHVARVSEPISVSTSNLGPFGGITIETHSAQGDVAALRRLLDPQLYGSLRALVEANAGSFAIEAEPPGILRVCIQLPASN